MTDAITIEPATRLEGISRVPGDKSISHRVLIVGAMGEGEMEIAGLSPAVDVTSSRTAVEQLGAQIHDSKAQVDGLKASSSGPVSQILLRSSGIRGWSEPGTVDAGNSGTTMRLLLGALAGSSIRARLTGDASLERRPMGRVVRPLRAMGASIEGADGGERAPLDITGTQLSGVIHTLDVPSAQVKSALLLAGLSANGETGVVEPGPSRDHTERLLKYLGVPIDTSGNRLVVKSTNIQNASVTIPGDISSAAFFLVAAALLDGSDVTTQGVGLNPTRTGVLEILRMFGAIVETADEREEAGEPVGTVRVRPAERRSLDIGRPLTVTAIDELPLVAVLGTAAAGRTIVRDAAELRVKESDRIAAMVAGLRAMGADIEATDDGFEVEGPSRLRGAEVDAAGDHRIAMALAVAALTAAGPTTITGWQSVAISYPGFAQDLESLVVR